MRTRRASSSSGSASDSAFRRPHPRLAPPSTGFGPRLSSTSRRRPRPPGNRCSTSSSKLRWVASKVSSKAAWILRSVSRISALQLRQRGLEVGALGLEALDVGERLLVLALGQRVDRPELLAAAAEALELALDLGALGVGERLAAGTELAPEHAPRSAPARRPPRSRRSPRWATRTSASVTASPAARSFACSSASSREQARSGSVTSSSAPSPSIRRSSARARSPAASRASAAASQSSPSAASSAASRSSRCRRASPGGGCRAGPRPGVPSGPRARRPRAAGRPPWRARRRRSRPAAAARAAWRELQRLADALEPGADGVVAGRAPVAAASSSASAPSAARRRSTARASSVAARRERLGADREPLVGGADRGQPAPGLGALAIALGEPLLDRGAALGSRRRARPSSSSRASRALRGRPLARRPRSASWPCSSEASRRARSSAASRSSRAWMSAACAWRFSGRRRVRASRSTSSARSRLSWVRSSLSWARRRRLRCLPRPGGLLDQQPPVARLRVDDLLDPALADHRVHLAAEVGVGERLDHVGEPARAPFSR